MRIKVAGMVSLELTGDIVDLEEKEGYLIMEMRANVGLVKATLTHRDLRKIIKLVLKPGNLRYMLFGFRERKNIGSQHS